MNRKFLVIAACLLLFATSPVPAETLSPVWQSQMTTTVDQLAGETRPLVILDARTEKQGGCIPGAVAVDWKSFYSEKKELLPAQERIAMFGALGISGAERVVIYDDGVKDGGASVVFWLLDSAGHTNVSILQGGLPAYTRAGLPTAAQHAAAKPATFSAAPRQDSAPAIPDVMEFFGDYDLRIVDPRSDEEYLGWPLHGEKRGGHIRGAFSFDPAWAYTEAGTLKPEHVIRKLALQKGVSPEKKFLTYSNWDPRGAQLYYLLRLLGYERVGNAAFTFNDWAAIDVLPVSSAKNWKSLVSPQWVDQLVRTGNAPTFKGGKFAIFEVDWCDVEKAEAYKAGHIPSSYHLNTFTVESKENFYDIHPTKLLFSKLAEAGIDKDTTVVLYGMGTQSIAATNVFWVLTFAGVEDVRLMNGNFERWKALGLPVETRVNTPEPVASFGRTELAHPEYIVDTEEAKRILADPNGRLASVRSWEEHSGKVVRHHYIKAKGEPYGACWARAGFGANKSDLSFYKDVDGSYRSYTEVAHMWVDLDIFPHNRVAFLCGTGPRATTAWFFTYLMGWPNSAVYDSGWYGWSQGKDVSPNPAQNIWEETHK